MDRDLYLDGLAQIDVLMIDEDNNLFKVKKEYYDESLTHWKDMIKLFPKQTKFTVFNYCCITELQKRLGDISDEELTNYTMLLIQIMSVSGIYKKLFGEGWEKELLDYEP